MDFSQVKTIKRREFTITSVNNKITDAEIEFANFTQNTNLINRKIKLESFYMNNKTMACFIPRPKMLDTDEYSPSYPIDTITGPTPSVTLNYFDTSTWTQNSLDYTINIWNKTTNVMQLYVLQMIPAFSEYLKDEPPSFNPNVSAFYKNKYFSFFNTSKFCELVTYWIKEAFSNFSPALTENIEIVRVGTAGYTVLVDDTFVTTNNCELQMSKSLIDLFQFKSVVSDNSKDLYTIIWNTETRTNSLGVDQYICSSNYIPDFWLPYDKIYFQTTLPITKQSQNYNNGNYLSEGYSNIMLTYKLVFNGVSDTIYNYFDSDLQPNSGFCSYVNTNSQETAKLNILLRIRQTGDLIPYTIGKDEKIEFALLELEFHE